MASLIFLACAAVTFLVVCRAAYQSIQKHRALFHIPTVGNSSWIGSFFSFVHQLFHAKEYFDECYYKYPNQACKIAGITGWTVILNGSLIDELVHLDDTHVSLGAAIHQLLRADYTLGPTTLLQPYQLPLIHRLAKSSTIEQICPGILDEASAAVYDHVNIRAGKEWTPFLAEPAMLQIVARVTNRVISGMDLCRNEQFLQVCMDYPGEVFKTAVMLNVVPEFARGLICRLFSGVQKKVSEAGAYLLPLIDERKSLGDAAPDDLLTWLLNAAPEGERSSSDIARRYLVVIFAALHTTTQLLTHTLYHIAANPDYADRLREEAQCVTSELGWSHAALQSLHSLDSVIRETGRYTGLGIHGLQRKAIKSFTFSDGTFIPEGTILNVTSSANHDPKFYHDPATFNPWRFCDDISERQSSSYVTSNYWLWGRGRHACPGRFFGTLEIKAILAQILLTYDIKTVDGRRPTDLNFVYLRLPNPRAKLLLRQREQEK